MSGAVASSTTGAEAARAACEEALALDDLREVERGLRLALGSVPDCRAVASTVTEAPEGQDAVRELDAALRRVGVQPRPTALERFVLLRSSLEALEVVPSLPLPPRVRELVYDAFQRFAAPPEGLMEDFALGGYPFSGMCKIASLRRFPAGQFDWEVSGIPRSFFLKARPRDLPRMLGFVARRVGGIRPLFMPHFSLFRKHLLVMREKEVNRSYHLMAQALELQPQIRGMVGASWFYSPDTYRITPHLSWLRAEIAENGGFTTMLGAARADSGVLAQSNRRKELYESAAFRPTEGLVIWPRGAMLRWAAAHPEHAA